MHYKSILVCSAFLITTASFANTIADSSATVAGKRVIIHTIEPKETWFSLSRKYGVNVTDLQAANASKDLKIGATVIIPKGGSVAVVVPSKPAVAEKAQMPTSAKPAAAMPDNSGKAVTYHTVEKGQTMFSISKKYNVTVAHIREWNNLTDDNVKLGQRLAVSKPAAGAVTASVSPSSPATKTTAKTNAVPGESSLDRIERLANSSIINKNIATADKPVETPKPKVFAKETPVVSEVPAPKQTAQIIEKPIVSEKPPVVEAPTNKPAEPVKQKETVAETTAVPKTDNFTPKKEITEKGTASWINDEDVNPNKYYALHRTAPIGTIIKVTNTMNNQNVFVKVVGSLPDTGDNSNLIIKISKAAAKKMDVLDAKFQAELSYGVAQ